MKSKGAIKSGEVAEEVGDNVSDVSLICIALLSKIENGKF